MRRREFLIIAARASLCLATGVEFLPGLASSVALAEGENNGPPREVQLNFIVDPRFVAWRSLSDVNSKNFLIKDARDVVAFQNRAWTLDRLAFELILGRDVQSEIVHSTFTESGKRIDALITRMIEDDTFKPVLNDTKEAANKTEAEWLGDYEKAYAAMKDITGINLKCSANVYVNHPAHRNGENNRGEIFWSYRTDFPHYNTVYMWHELMHIILSGAADWHKNVASLDDAGGESKQNGQAQRPDVEHAIIELCTDHELRKRLGGPAYPPFIGHEFLVHIQTKLMPSWTKYLQAPSRNVRDFIKLSSSIV